MILNRGPPSELETSNKISNSGGTDMYIEHPYFYEVKYYANIDGEMIEITKEVAYAMNNFYRSSKAISMLPSGRGYLSLRLPQCLFFRFRVI